ncbi:uncharacterized protein MYCGRDRAFT_97728 [Zymoseptoria tritici IPO323]|uniref:Uncharacterized protein n=1 Tax=Zymoseptoria tritici (strain CBS 115943 / IPO323) TaxID=336722 RepID=F9XR68_ZYMTI|nr:uncharacterized protein MYCGRDRAFT_97728 [Zymoseptoria tritici IPO323]EGP82206.1 hypothetical protein MYCGRDRAFT_97728 [Zymoseptoria tritici IPO323]
MAFITEISVTELSGSTRDPGVTSFSIDVPNRTISSYSHILLDVSFPTGVFVQPILDFAIKSIDGLGLLSKRSVAKFRSQIIRPFLPPEDHPLLPLLLRTSNTGDLVQPSLDFAIKAIDGADLLQHNTAARPVLFGTTFMTTMESFSAYDSALHTISQQRRPTPMPRSSTSPPCQAGARTQMASGWHKDFSACKGWRRGVPHCKCVVHISHRSSGAQENGCEYDEQDLDERVALRETWARAMSLPHQDRGHNTPALTTIFAQRITDPHHTAEGNPPCASAHYTLIRNVARSHRIRASTRNRQRDEACQTTILVGRSTEHILGCKTAERIHFWGQNHDTQHLLHRKQVTPRPAPTTPSLFVLSFLAALPLSCFIYFKREHEGWRSGRARRWFDQQGFLNANWQNKSSKHTPSAEKPASARTYTTSSFEASTSSSSMSMHHPAAATQSLSCRSVESTTAHRTVLQLPGLHAPDLLKLTKPTISGKRQHFINGRV